MRDQTCEISKLFNDITLTLKVSKFGIKCFLAYCSFIFNEAAQPDEEQDSPIE